MLGRQGRPAWSGRGLSAAAAATAVGADAPPEAFGRPRWDPRGQRAACCVGPDRLAGTDLERLRGAGEGQRATMGSQPSTQEIWLRGLARRQWSLKDLATGEKRAATPAAQRGRQGAARPPAASLPRPASRAPLWAALVSLACALWPPISGFLHPCPSPHTHCSEGLTRVVPALPLSLLSERGPGVLLPDSGIRLCDLSPYACSLAQIPLGQHVVFVVMVPWAPGLPVWPTWGECRGIVSGNEGLTFWTLDSGRGLPLPLTFSLPYLIS